MCESPMPSLTMQFALRSEKQGLSKRNTELPFFTEWLLPHRRRCELHSDAVMRMGVKQRHFAGGLAVRPIRERMSSEIPTDDAALAPRAQAGWIVWSHCATPA